MKSTRAKLVCNVVEPHGEGTTKTGETVHFSTLYNPDDSPEDNTYSAATPSANMTMHISNPEVFGNFEPGQAYYFDITKAPASKAASE